jgi:hypothetical protein
MVPVLTQSPRAFSLGPLQQASSSGPGKYNNCANEAVHCQERIQCLEKALGFMQTELNRLQREQNYMAKTTEEEEEEKNNNCNDQQLRSSSSNKKRIQYDKITVWPSSPSVLLEDFCGRSLKHLKYPPKPLPRTTASLHDKLTAARAKTVAPPTSGYFTTTAFNVYHRATSAPPASPALLLERLQQQQQLLRRYINSLHSRQMSVYKSRLQSHFLSSGNLC